MKPLKNKFFKNFSQIPLVAKTIWRYEYSPSTSKNVSNFSRTAAVPHLTKEQFDKGMALSKKRRKISVW